MRERRANGFAADCMMIHASLCGQIKQLGGDRNVAQPDCRKKGFVVKSTGINTTSQW